MNDNMTDYSYSRLQVFQQCPFKYRLMYIDKIARFTKGIEGFMGDMVHRTLRDLHARVDEGGTMTVDEMLDIYRSHWNGGWSDDVVIVKKNRTAADYLQSGAEMLIAYYDKYEPFDQMSIVGLETDERLQLPDGNRYYIKIDKLTRVDDTYYVCDYKTGAKGVTQTDAEADSQLGMYSLWVLRTFPQAGKVLMRWYSLADGREVTCEKGVQALQALEAKVVRTISAIESCKNFSTRRTGLCSYCQYQDLCPEFKR
ncbi:MAG: PD-(D/E)XK nuclease family protein [Methanomassiliicoccales archaeon]|nr:PD-(D/E)XK nuclease family protein [Methanomassiliicoccales archaeon]